MTSPCGQTAGSRNRIADTFDNNNFSIKYDFTKNIEEELSVVF